MQIEDLQTQDPKSFVPCLSRLLRTVSLVVSLLGSWTAAQLHGTEAVTFDEFADPETEVTSVGDVLRSNGIVFTLDIGLEMNLINLAHENSIGSPAISLSTNVNYQHYLHVAREDGKAFDLHWLDLAKVVADDTSTPLMTVRAYRDVGQGPEVIQSFSLDGLNRVQRMVLNDMTDITYAKIDVLQTSGVLVDALSYDKKDQTPVPALKLGFHHFYASGNEVDLDCYPLILGREYRIESSDDLAIWTGYNHTAHAPRIAFYVYWSPDAPKRRFFRLSWQETGP